MADDISAIDLMQKNSTSSCQDVGNENIFVPVRESRSFGGAKKSQAMCLTVTEKELEKLAELTTNDSNVNIHTCDQATMTSYTVGPEILLFQGTMHTKEEIAPMWKKDCRMWLWKSSKHNCNPKDSRLF